MSMKFAHNVGWYVVIIDGVIVAAGCDFNTMITRQEREKAERPSHQDCKMVTFYAKNKKQAVKACMESMSLCSLSVSLRAELRLK
jgi:hypothetical protein